LADYILQLLACFLSLHTKINSKITKRSC